MPSAKCHIFKKLFQKFGARAVSTCIVGYYCERCFKEEGRALAPALGRAPGKHPTSRSGSTRGDAGEGRWLAGLLVGWLAGCCFGWVRWGAGPRFVDPGARSYRGTTRRHLRCGSGPITFTAKYQWVRGYCGSTGTRQRFAYSKGQVKETSS